jgi:two-component system NtrC family sensor kinase
MSKSSGQNQSGTAPRLDTAESHARLYAAVVRSALDAIIVVDEAGTVISINPAAEAMFGYSAEDAIGRSVGELIVPDHHRAAHEAGMARYQATRVPHVLGRRVLMEARCRDGSIIPVELAITEVELPDGRLFTAHLRNLASERAAAAEIERQREALYQNEKLAAIGSLLAGVAHELNNPLSVVLGQASVLREEMEADASRPDMLERAAAIEGAAERCARVVRSFLSIARQRKAEKSVFEVTELLDASLELVAYGLASNGVEVIRDYGAKCQVFADRDQVQNIIVNLLVNAMQALDGVERQRRIHVGAHSDPKRGFVVSVDDNGPGIPEGIAGRIFDPFFTTKPQGVGTGIGLAISRGLAEAQGGRLALARSRLGGAAFELVLPIQPAEIARAASAARPQAEVPVPVRAQGCILVIDDEPEISMLLAQALRRASYECDIAADGRAAQVLIEKEPGRYAAVVCDLRMPGLDGPGLFRWLAEHHPQLAHKTMFVTGDALGPVAGRFLAESRRPVLEKPFTPADVVRLVGDVVGSSPPETNETTLRTQDILQKQ